MTALPHLTRTSTQYPPINWQSAIENRQWQRLQPFCSAQFLSLRNPTPITDLYSFAAFAVLGAFA